MRTETHGDTNGIEFAFDDGSLLETGERIVVVDDAKALQCATVNSHGSASGRVGLVTPESN